MTVLDNSIETLLQSLIVPLGLLLILLAIRAALYVGYMLTRKRPLPVIVHEIAWEDAYFPDSCPGQEDALAAESWQTLPSLLRDYISADPSLSRQLAPGVATTGTPAITAAAPDGSQFGWPGALVRMVLPRKEAAYNIYVTPHREPFSS
jgi:hypothetical protein